MSTPQSKKRLRSAGPLTPAEIIEAETPPEQPTRRSTRSRKGQQSESEQTSSVEQSPVPAESSLAESSNATVEDEDSSQESQESQEQGRERRSFDAGYRMPVSIPSSSSPSSAPLSEQQPPGGMAGAEQYPRQLEQEYEEAGAVGSQPPSQEPTLQAQPAIPVSEPVGVLASQQDQQQLQPIQQAEMQSQLQPPDDSAAGSQEGILPEWSKYTQSLIPEVGNAEARLRAMNTEMQSIWDGLKRELDARTQLFTAQTAQLMMRHARGTIQVMDDVLDTNVAIQDFREKQNRGYSLTGNFSSVFAAKGDEFSMQMRQPAGSSPFSSSLSPFGSANRIVGGHVSTPPAAESELLGGAEYEGTGVVDPAQQQQGYGQSYYGDAGGNVY